jgi:hypothetical protein
MWPLTSLGFPHNMVAARELVQATIIVFQWVEWKLFCLFLPFFFSQALKIQATWTSAVHAREQSHCRTACRVQVIVASSFGKYNLPRDEEQRHWALAVDWPFLFFPFAEFSLLLLLQSQIGCTGMNADSLGLCTSPRAWLQKHAESKLLWKHMTWCISKVGHPRACDKDFFHLSYSLVISRIRLFLDLFESWKKNIRS